VIKEAPIAYHRIYMQPDSTVQTPIDGQARKALNRHAGAQTDRKVGRCISRGGGWERDRQTERQTERYTERERDSKRGINGVKRT
jgi:hypothetical protein